VRIDRILENRIFSKKENSYKIFEKKVVDACYLERKIMMMKFGKREQYQARNHYIVFLVSCLEFFLEEIFKLSLDKGVILLKDIKKAKKFNSIKANLEELDEINKNRIKTSEILAERMNFQNMEDITLLGDLLEIVKNFKKISSKKKKSKLSLLEKKIPIPLKKSATNEKIMTKFILESFGMGRILPKKDKDLIKMVNTVRKMISLRHKIVHKAERIKIDNWESLAYTMATKQLAFFINECYKIKLSKLLKNNKRTK